MSALAEALAGGGRFHKWETDRSVSGTIVSVEMRQATKFGTTEPDRWDDGTAKNQAVIALSTSLRDPADPEDDGLRRIAINLWSGQRRALGQACRDAGVPEPRAGDGFSATWESGAGTAASPRVFAYRITPGSGLAPALAAVPAEDPWKAPVPAEQPPARPAPAAPPAAAKPLGEQAREYLAQGLDVPTVADLTGLPPTTVAALKNTL